MGSDAAEFVNKVKDQVRNRQKRMSSIAESCDEHSIIWGMFMATTLNAATFMGKIFSTIQSVVKNHESLTLKQMFDVTAQLVNNQEEINCLDKILYGTNSWTHLSLINDEIVINLQSNSLCILRFCVMSRKGSSTSRIQQAWKNRGAGVRAERSYRDYDAINGESTEFEWNIFPGFTTLQLCDKISDLLSSMGQTPETFTRSILFMSMFNDISSDKNSNKDECLKNASFVKTFAGRFGFGQWSFIGPGSEKVVFFREQSTRSLGPYCGRNVAGIRRKRTSYLPCNDSIVHGVSSKAKDEENCPYTSLQIKIQLIHSIALFFLSISSVSAEQWQLYARNLRTIKIERVNL